MVRVGSIVIRVDDLERQAAFWEAALDYERGIFRPDEFALLRPRDGAGPNVSLDRVRSSVQIPPRIHLDLYADDQAECPSSGLRSVCAGLPRTRSGRTESPRFASSAPASPRASTRSICARRRRS